MPAAPIACSPSEDTAAAAIAGTLELVTIVNISAERSSVTLGVMLEESLLELQPKKRGKSERRAKNNLYFFDMLTFLFNF